MSQKIGLSSSRLEDGQGLSGPRPRLFRTRDAFLGTGWLY